MCKENVELSDVTLIQLYSNSVVVVVFWHLLILNVNFYTKRLPCHMHGDAKHEHQQLQQATAEWVVQVMNAIQFQHQVDLSLST